ncbi:MAG: hypothetical protein IBJ16_11240 [Chitinophagaceae bacterium]|nr:hypothetical protein [Chitinophagaceae bacterium]
MASLGRGLRLPSFGLGNEEDILRNYGMADGLISLSSNEQGLAMAVNSKLSAWLPQPNY